MGKTTKAVLLVFIGLSTSLFLRSSTAFAASTSSYFIHDDLWTNTPLSSLTSTVLHTGTTVGVTDIWVLSRINGIANNIIYASTTDFGASGVPFRYVDIFPFVSDGNNYYIFSNHDNLGGNNGSSIVFLTIQGGVWSWSEFVSTGLSRIDSFTFSTSTNIANVTGYWEATTTPFVTQRLSFWQFSDGLGKESYTQYIATTTGYFNFSFDFKSPYGWSLTNSSTTPIYSSFSLNASLDQYDETNFVFPIGGEVINNIAATSTTILSSSYNATDFTLNPRALAQYPEFPCSVTSLIGCIKNALIWAFYPTADTLTNFNSLVDVMKSKPPAGYFYVVKSNLDNLSATGTKPFNIVIPRSIKNYIFSPFDIGIAGVLWFYFIINFYKRLKHITI